MSALDMFRPPPLERKTRQMPMPCMPASSADPGNLGVGAGRRRVCSTSVRPAAGAAGARKRVLLRLGAIVAPASASVIVSSVLLAKNYDKDL